MERYYNENPQVTLWKEEAYKWKLIADESIKTAHECNETTHDYAQLVDKANKQSRESIELSKEWAETVRDLRNKMRTFDTLPWYRKMFYKFKV